LDVCGDALDGKVGQDDRLAVERHDPSVAVGIERLHKAEHAVERKDRR